MRELARAQYRGSDLKDITLGPNAATFSPDGSRLLTTGEGRDSVLLWNVDTRQELLRLDGLNYSGAAEFSDDGTMIMSRSIFQAAGARIWRAPTLGEIESIERRGGGW